MTVCLEKEILGYAGDAVATFRVEQFGKGLSACVIYCSEMFWVCYPFLFSVESRKLAVASWPIEFLVGVAFGV